MTDRRTPTRGGPAPGAERAAGAALVPICRGEIEQHVYEDYIFPDCRLYNLRHSKKRYEVKQTRHHIMSLKTHEAHDIPQPQISINRVTLHYLVGLESEPGDVATADGGWAGSAGVGAAAAAAAAGAAAGGAAAVGAVADMALLTASTRTHSAASSWQMATSTSSMPVQAWNGGIILEQVKNYRKKISLNTKSYTQLILHLVS